MYRQLVNGKNMNGAWAGARFIYGRMTIRAALSFANQSARVRPEASVDGVNEYFNHPLGFAFVWR